MAGSSDKAQVDETDTMRSDIGTPHPLSSDYAALSEMTYRRAADGNSSHIDNIKGVESVNLLESPKLQAAANEWQEGADVQTYLQEQYGLTIDPEDRGDGLMHVYTDNGFSGYVTQRGLDTPDPSDDQFIIAYRGTDMADNADKEMGGGLLTAAKPLLPAAGWGKVGAMNNARDAHPTPEAYRNAITDDIDQPFENFTVSRDADGHVTERLVDAGDIYTNGLLGQGTYQETQYDDARAMFDVVNDHLTTDGQEVVLTGQSLGGGLAALVSAEKGVESHTFGMAPFQRQFEIIGQRNAVSDLLTDPETSTQFGDLAEQYAEGTIPERDAIERSLSDDISGLRTIRGGHAGASASKAIRDFNTENGTQIDRDLIRDFNTQADKNAAAYEENKNEIYASTVAGEFTTNSGEGSVMGAGVESGSEQIIPTDKMHTYNIGPDQTDLAIQAGIRVQADGGRVMPWTGQVNSLATRGMGEGLTSHSPALNDLVTASQSSDVGAFNDLMADNPNLRYSLLHRPGLAGGVTSGKIGPDDDMSASQSLSATNESVYRPLANSLRGDGALYEETHSYFDTLSTQGRGAEGADIEDVSLPSLNGAMTQFGLQELRIRTENLDPGKTLDGDVAPIGTAQDGLVAFDMADLSKRNDGTPLHDMNRLKNATRPIEDVRGIHGYTDLQTVFFDEIRVQMVSPSDQGFSERDAVATARVAGEITGATQDFRNFNMTEGRLNVPEGSLEFRRAMVETGTQIGTDVKLHDLAEGDLRAGEGTAIFLGSGENIVTGSNQPDMVSLGAGDDGYISQVRGGGIVSGGEDYDSFSLQQDTGPVFAVVNENYTSISRMDDPNSPEKAIGMERFSLSQQDDIIVMQGVSNGTLIDGAEGRNFVDYRELDNDFYLDMRDGVLPTGEAYTSRITDGESSQYFINIADEDIARQAAPTSHPEPSLEDSHDGASLHTTEPLIRTAEHLQEDYPKAQSAISEAAASGKLTLEDAHIGKLLAQSGSAQIFSDLDAAGVRELAIPQHDVTNPISAMRARLEAGQTALVENDLPTPESDYLPAQDMTGVSNAEYTAAAALGGAEGEAHLKAAGQARLPEVSEAQTQDLTTSATVEDEYSAYA